MNNILDYIAWRGDISFRKAGMNEVDGLIFAKLSYLFFDTLLDEDTGPSVTIREYRKIASDKGIKILNMLFVKTEDYVKLLDACAESHRFGNVRISNYINLFDSQKEMQFAAVTFEIDSRNIVIAFRGTDDTVAGWKEDFNMGFLEAVPSQTESLKYLNRVSEICPDRKIYLTGHSKGGNLALYSAINSPLKVNTRIERVYNYDGPGFITAIDEMPTYKRLMKRITTLVPESSIIGMLLERREASQVVRSSATGGFNQHNGFTWDVLGTSFVRADDRDRGSRMIDTALKSYLRNSTIEQRKTFADALSQILKGYEDYTLTDLTADKIQVINRLAKSIEGLDKETKTILISSMRLVFTEGISAVRGSSRPTLKIGVPGILGKRRSTEE